MVAVICMPVSLAAQFGEDFVSFVHGSNLDFNLAVGEVYDRNGVGSHSEHHVAQPVIIVVAAQVIRPVIDYANVKPAARLGLTVVFAASLDARHKLLCRPGLRSLQASKVLGARFARQKRVQRPQGSRLGCGLILGLRKANPVAVNMLVKPEDAGGIERSVDVRVHPFFFEGREGELTWEQTKDFQQFTYGYALTVHKSQGSQWNNVVLFDESGAFREDRARWLYTGVTRAAEQLTVVM